VSFSSLLGDSTGASFASADSTVVRVAAYVVGTAGVATAGDFSIELAVSSA
jgi:hypothetical protein